MHSPLNLNSSHKAGLFLVLIAAGGSLLFEASAKQTAGVVLLGLAATWFFGSLAVRTLGLTFSLVACCVGLCLAILPIWKDWESYRVSAQQYALSGVREAIARQTEGGGERREPEASSPC